MIRDLCGVVRSLLPIVGDGMLYYLTEYRSGYVRRGADGFEVVPAGGPDFGDFQARLGRRSSAERQYLLLYAWIVGEGYRAYLVTYGSSDVNALHSVLEPMRESSSFALDDLQRGIEYRLPMSEVAEWLRTRFAGEGYEAMPARNVVTLADIFRREWPAAA